MRSISPTTATLLPAISVGPDGFASQRTATANRNPSGTRRRARRRVSSVTAPLRCGQPAFDGVQHFGDFDVEQAHAWEPASPQMVALAHGCARHGDIVGTKRTIAFGTRRSVDADQRCPD